MTIFEMFEIEKNIFEFFDFSFYSLILSIAWHTAINYVLHLALHQRTVDSSRLLYKVLGRLEV